MLLSYYILESTFLCVITLSNIIMSILNKGEHSMIDITDEKVLKAIEFSVESRMNLESEEQCTIIAHPEIIKGIKIAIAKQQIFTEIYSRLIFQENPSAEITNENEIVIIPDSMIEEAIQDQIKNHLSTNEEVQQKLKELNNKMEGIPEETLNRISQLPEKELTEEELILKSEIQSKMIEVGMNIDLQFSDTSKAGSAVDDIFEKVANQNSAVNLKGLE